MWAHRPSEAGGRPRWSLHAGLRNAATKADRRAAAVGTDQLTLHERTTSRTPHLARRKSGL
eukprot:365842-Chlamydomonas_euryale.AAC.6